MDDVTKHKTLLLMCTSIIGVLGFLSIQLLSISKELSFIDTNIKYMQTKIENIVGIPYRLTLLENRFEKDVLFADKLEKRVYDLETEQQITKHKVEKLQK